MALLELLLAAAWAWIVATNVFQGVAHRLLVAVVAVRAVHMAVVVIMMIVTVVAVWAMNMGLLGHCWLLRFEIAGHYLTTAAQVQVLMDDQPGFELALQAIMQHLVAFE